MKKNSILIAVLGTLLLVLGIVINFVININNKNKELKDTKNEIITNYSKLEEDMQIFNGEREIILNISNNYYDENLVYNYTSWVSSFDDYLSSVKNIAGYKNFILDKCVDKDYNDSNVNSKCQSMMMSYETVINYFVKDVTAFNNFLESYNASHSNDTKELFSLNGYNYIDIDDDGKYLGK